MKKSSLHLILILQLTLSCFLSNTYAQPGSLDTGFGTNGIVITAIGLSQDKAYSVIIQSDDKILVAGAEIVTGIDNDFALVRYNNDGSPDVSFGNGGIVTTPFGNGDDAGYAVAIQPNGKIVVGGYSDGDPGPSVTNDFAIARYNIDGTLDTDFGTGGLVTTNIGGGGFGDVGHSVAIQSNGKILLSGWTNAGSSPNDFVITRYDSSGIPDNSFGTNGTVITNFGNSSDEAYAMAIQSDGKIILAGTSAVSGFQPDFGLARYNTDGALDTDFGANGLVTTDFGTNNDVGQAICIQGDGKIIVAGFTYAASTDFAMARYNIDGSLDTSFGTDGKVTTGVSAIQDYGRSVSLQADGKIVVAGSSGGFGNGDFALVRYETDGSLDSTFGTDGKVITDCAGNSDDVANAVAIQSDGKIVLAGFVWGDFALARYNVTLLGTDEINFNNSFVIISNPKTNIFTISLSSTLENSKLKIYNTLGQEIFQSADLNSNNEIDLSSNAKGIYFVKIVGEKNYTKKIIIQ